MQGAPKDNIILRLYKEGKKYQDIADMVGMSYSHVSQRIPKLLDQEKFKEPTGFNMDRGEVYVRRAPVHKKFDLKPGDRVKSFDYALNRHIVLVVEKLYEHIFLCRCLDNGLRSAFCKVDYSIGVVHRTTDGGTKNVSKIPYSHTRSDSSAGPSAVDELLAASPGTE